MPKQKKHSITDYEVKLPKSWLIAPLLVLLCEIFIIICYFDSSSLANKMTWMYFISFLSILNLIAGLYLLKRFTTKICVSGYLITIYALFKKPKQFSFEHITKIKCRVDLTSIAQRGDTEQIYKMYVQGKSVCKISWLWLNFDVFLGQLIRKGIPIKYSSFVSKSARATNDFLFK